MDIILSIDCVCKAKFVSLLDNVHPNDFFVVDLQEMVTNFDFHLATYSCKCNVVVVGLGHGESPMNLVLQ